MPCPNADQNPNRDPNIDPDPIINPNSYIQNPDFKDQDILI